jgi:hypothetical protein
MEFEEALEPRHTLPMTKVIAVGFGAAYVTQDGNTIWQEDLQANWDDLWTVQKAEDAALLSPESDWRVHLIGPLAEGHWQRQGNAEWVMYAKGIGFA